VPLGSRVARCQSYGTDLANVTPMLLRASSSLGRDFGEALISWW